jgi:Raf kinase inhibitor-like YbhB/YbcL family protein
MPFKLQSPEFGPDRPIPVHYTCDGRDVSPPLGWTAPPPLSRSFALIMDDPDAGAQPWIHWVLWNLPGELRQLPQGASPGGPLHPAVVEGVNSWGRNGYGGPCPPRGRHRYRFTLHALDRALDVNPRWTVADLREAMAGHELARAELVSPYRRAGSGLRGLESLR